MPTKSSAPSGTDTVKAPGNSKRRKTSAGKPAKFANGQNRAKAAGSAKGKESSPAAKWTFFTNHAHVLICLYEDSEMVLRDIATRVGITERAVQRIVQELEEAEFLERERVGRRNHYRVNRDKHLRHPIEEHCTVDALFGVILDRA